MSIVSIFRMRKCGRLIYWEEKVFCHVFQIKQ